ncbi:hypothetical protein J4465_03215 [Candidatus Pacearchaeota archaeon]|nr:hypothetical protein [uncultured archaeon]MBS3073777.1 hypothetical protein [Candidatus Pacearchaeota archaeon]
MAQRKLVNEIIMMIRQNFTSSDILKQLREEGFNPAEIREGIDQAQTKIELAKAAGDESLAFATEDFDEEAIEETPTPSSGRKMSKSIMIRPEIEERSDFHMQGRRHKEIDEGEDETSRETSEENYPEELQEDTRFAERKKMPLVPKRREESFEREEPSRYSEEQSISPSPAPSQEGGYESPSYSYQQPVQSTMGESDIDEMVEEIVNDKIREIETKIGNLDSFKQNIEKQIKTTDENMKKFEIKMKDLNEGILSKMQEINIERRAMNAEVIALENAFLKILSPLVSNMKDINKIANEANKINFKKATNIDELNKKISESKIKREENTLIKKEKEKETLDRLLKRTKK